MNVMILLPALWGGGGGGGEGGGWQGGGWQRGGGRRDAYLPTHCAY